MPAYFFVINRNTVPNEIRTENVIVSFEAELEKFNRQVEQSTKLVDSIQDRAKDAGKAMETALREQIVTKYNKLLKDLGSNLEAAGIDAGKLNDQLDSLPLEELVKLNDLVDEFDRSLDQSQRRTARIANNMRRFFAFVGNGFRQMRNLGARAFNTISNGVSSLFRRIGQVGGLVAILGITDLITGWSTFSQQVRTTLSQFPPLQRAGSELNQTFRQLAEVFARTIGPFLARFAESINNIARGTDLGKIQRLFTAIGTVLQTIGREIVEVFSPGGQAGNAVISFATFVAAVFNGVASTISEFANTTKAIWLDLQRFSLRAAALILNLTAPAQAAVLIAQARSLDIQAKEARANMGSIVDAFRKGFEEIQNLPIPDIKWEGIQPTAEQQEEIQRAIEGSLDFYREHISRLKEEQGRLAPETAAQLGIWIIELERSLTRAEREIQQRIDKMKGLFRELQELSAEVSIDFDGDPFTTLARTREQISEGLIGDTENRIQSQIDVLERAMLAVINNRLQPALMRVVGEYNRAIADGTAFISRDSGSLIKELNEDADETQKIFDSLSASNARFRAKLEDEEKEAEDKRMERIASIVDLYQNIIGAVNEAFQAQSNFLQQQSQILDDLANQQQNRITQALQLADRGNAELVQIEEERLERINQAQQRNTREQQQLARIQIGIAQAVAIAQGIAAVVQGFIGGNFVGGIASAVALTGSIAALVIGLNNAFASIPTFWKGTEYLKGPGTGTSDSILLRGSKGERIMTADQNRKIGSMTNSEVVKYANIGKSVVYNQQAYHTPVINTSKLSATYLSMDDLQKSQERRLDALNEEVSGLRSDIRKLSINFNVTEDGIEASVSRVTARKNRRNKIIR